MSDSESDNLEFESADEGQNEADLSDLDLDEILNEDDDENDDAKISKRPIESNKTTPDNQESSNRPEDEPNRIENTDKTQLESESNVKTNVEEENKVSDHEELITIEEKKVQPEPEPEPEQKQEQEPAPEPEKPAVDNVWDEQDEDVDKMLNDMNLDEGKNDEPKETIAKVPESTAKTSAVVEQKPTSGWDDTNFSDIDDEDESGQTKSDMSVKTAPATIKKEESKPRLEEEVKKPDEEKVAPKKETNQSASSGWSWSKFSTNILSSAATLTSQVFETVEAHLGAPDPTELAAKIAKSKSEHTVNNPDANDPNESDKTDKARGSLTPNETNNWQQFEESDWFTFNKLTSTGTNLVSGSLDVLESVGKKTFEMISDKDPSLKQTKELLKKVPVPVSNKPNLSQVFNFFFILFVF